MMEYLSVNLGMGFTSRSTMHRTSGMCVVYTIVLYFLFGVSFLLCVRVLFYLLIL
jgi:hypothetical protein